MHNTFLTRIVLFFSFLFLSTSVFSAPVFGTRGQPAPQIRDSISGETNAKRLANGLPLLPPALKARASKTDSECTRKLDPCYGVVNVMWVWCVFSR